MSAKESLQTEARELRARLERNPTYRRLLALERMIRDYEALPEEASEEAPRIKEPVVFTGGDVPKLNFGRDGSASSLVQQFCYRYLDTKNQRAMSGELAKACEAGGVNIPGKKPESTLSSYLSVSDLFDNVRGEGYGLAKWANKGLPLIDETKTETAATH